MSATWQEAQVIVAQVRDHLTQSGIGSEEVVANVRAVFDGVALEFTIESRVHLVEQHAVDIAGKEVVPF